jgi:hypothetical protein
VLAGKISLYSTNSPSQLEEQFDPCAHKQKCLWNKAAIWRKTRQTIETIISKKENLF